MKRTRVVLVGSVLFVGLTIAAACSFPNPTLEVVKDAGGPVPVADASTDQGVDSATDPVDSSSAPVPGAYDGGEAVIVKDAGTAVDAAGCTTCDCDKDTFFARGCDAGSNIPEAQRDCDDKDSRYRNDQGFLDQKPPASKTGDWNCDGTVTKYFTHGLVCGGLLANCSGQEGFSGDPGCGEEGRYIFCKGGGLLSCVEDTAKTQTRTQACQ